MKSQTSCYRASIARRNARDLPSIATIALGLKRLTLPDAGAHYPALPEI